MYRADQDIGRSVARRVRVVKVDDTGEIQRVTVQGLADEFFELPLRGQGHGLTGHPSVGAVGYLYMANGRPDQAYLSDMEHPEQRPKDLKDGETTLYAKKKQKVHMDEQGTTTIETPEGNVIVKSQGGIVHINPPGS